MSDRMGDQLHARNELLADARRQLGEVALLLRGFIHGPLEVKQAIRKIDALIDLTGLAAGPACRECGCTEGLACEGGCFWVAEEEPHSLGPVCSMCVSPVEEEDACEEGEPWVYCVECGGFGCDEGGLPGSCNECNERGEVANG